MSFYGLVLVVFVLAVVFFIAYFLGELNYLNGMWLASSSAVHALHAYGSASMSV